MVQKLQANEHKCEASLFARRRFVCACINFAIEEIIFATVVESRVAIHAQEVSLAVSWLLIESIFWEAEAFRRRILRALESKIAGGVAIWHHIGPV